MKNNFLLSLVVLIFLLSILSFTGINVNNKVVKLTEAIYPVKVHVIGIKEGDNITYYIDEGTEQYSKRAHFIVNLNAAGSHCICVQSSGEKWGYSNFVRDSSPMIQDIYINVSPGNNKCQNIK